MNKNNFHQISQDNLQCETRKLVKLTQHDEEEEPSSSQNTQQLYEDQQNNEAVCQKDQVRSQPSQVKKTSPIEGKIQEIRSDKMLDKPEQTKNKTSSNPEKQEKHNQPKQIQKSQKCVDHNQQVKQTHKNSIKQQTKLSSQNKQQISQSQQPHHRRPIHILAVSDNHGDYKMMNQILELKGDIFIHAGDFTYQGKDEDFEKFFNFLDKLKFRHKIVISGNHQNVLSKLKLKTITKMSRQKIISQLKKRCIYLQHESVEIQGVKIFASPYTPQYCQKPISRAFQYKSSHDNLIWGNIPADIHLLVTHGPPYGILDSGKNGKRAGSEALKLAVSKIKPKYHIFGHIHESKGGMTKIENTTYINLCNTPTRFIIEI